jgi:hypothetical protein
MKIKLIKIVKYGRDKSNRGEEYDESKLYGFMIITKSSLTINVQ